MLNRTYAPWTTDDVAALNDWQLCGWVHPFTCPHIDAHPKIEGSKQLVATPDGWHCQMCGYTQNWAHAWMLKDHPLNPVEALKAEQEGER